MEKESKPPEIGEFQPAIIDATAVGSKEARRLLSVNRRPVIGDREGKKGGLANTTFRHARLERTGAARIGHQKQPKQ